MESPPPFQVLNPNADGPVIVSVPHAGRTYDALWAARLRPTPEAVVALEDRYADAVVEGVTDAPVLIATQPRVYIDLNRHEAELDPGLVEGVVASRLILSPKVRNGLGLVPRRLAGVGELWRSKLSMAEVEARVAFAHRPYHLQLASLIRRALERHGIALLLDIHSMPTLPASAEKGPTDIVIGNRFGQSAAGWTTALAAQTCAGFALSWRENSPYAGGYIVERHGAPARGVHALQLEIDRSLYLHPATNTPHRDGVARIRSFVAQLVDRLGGGALDRALPLAAE